ncbi:MAG TPA: AraC family transcriptional regulator [Myxococcaceae bacterium]|nr:AraC family transcriptional regulator [Myxococcaceae bacterium]
METRLSQEERALDVLSDVLGLLRLRGQVYCRTQLTAPWGLSFTADQAQFHVVERGSCLLQPDGFREMIAVSEGDLVLLPHGRGHRLLSAPDSKAVPIKVAVAGQREGPLTPITHGGGGARTDLVCGRFGFDLRLAGSILSSLPPVLHVSGSQGRPVEWLDLTVRFLRSEARSGTPGRSVALARLVDLLFVEAIRHWLTTSDAQPTGWMGALRDPRIGAALVRIHAEPARDWDVETLAAEVGMSRSSFAQHFADLVGEPPSKYLTRWRMYLAARLLRVPGTTVAQVADRVGYDSEAAFSRVFKRYMQVAPAAFRDEATGQQPRKRRLSA